MRSAAQKQPEELVVTNHAIYRRLDFERMPRQDKILFIELFREQAEAIILDELAAAIELTPPARRIFMHPGRESVIGLVKPRVYYDHTGRRRTSTSFRLNDGRYLFTGDVIYVVDRQIVVTCILPDDRQVETLFAVMPEAEKHAPRTRYITDSCRLSAFTPPDAAPVNGLRHEPLSSPDWRDEAHAVWTVIVVGDADADQNLEGRAVREIQKEAGGGLALIEPSEDRALGTVRDMLQYFGGVECRDMPPLPEVDWSKAKERIPSKMKNWWNRMMGLGVPEQRLLAVMTPRSAMALLEAVDGSSDAGWRKHEDCCSPGRKINLIFGKDSVLVGRDRY